jgi:two-component system, cell cycle response regulator DivK
MASSLPLILLVDDFLDALEMYAEYLEFRGYRVVAATSGRAAVEAVRREAPALIFMDLRMPELTGTETLRLLRANPDLADVPVIAFTAHAFVDERNSALLEGFDEVIAKPCLPDDLAVAVERLLAQGRSART